SSDESDYFDALEHYAPTVPMTDPKPATSSHQPTRPEPYSGVGDVNAWLNLLYLHVHLNHPGYTPDDFAEQIVLNLSGNALKWAMTHLTSDGKIAISTDDFIAELKANFTAYNDKQLAESELSRLRLTSTVQAFITAFNQ
ncbi:hypothetical protein FBU31_006037, partial [Coemansia sp. 'formosensis']